MVRELLWQACRALFRQRRCSDTSSAVVCFWMEAMCPLMLTAVFVSSVSGQVSSTFSVMSRIVAQSGFGGLFAGRSCCYIFWIIILGLHVITPLICCLSARFPPTVDQSGPGLRRYDQHLWIWQRFFPRTQPGEDPPATAEQWHLIVRSPFSPKPTPVHLEGRG